MKHSPLGKAIRIALIQRNLTVKDYAIQAGVHPTHISNIIGGRYQPSWALLQKLAWDLDLDLNAILEATHQEVTP